MKNRGITLAAIAALATTPGVFANLITLSDGNSNATIDTGSQAGMNSWMVDGTSQLAQQWFWLRTGNTAEQSLDSLNQIGISMTDTNPFTNTGLDNLAVKYAGNGYEVELNYTLRGGAAGSGQADLAEQIIIRNTGAVALDFSFFQYSNFQLAGTPGNDSVLINGGNTAIQSDPSVNLSETVVTPAPTAYQTGSASGLLNSLNDGTATTLANTAGPVFAGDLGWAFQWDFQLGVNSSFIISKDKSIQPGPSPLLPTPGAAIVLAMGGLVAGRRRRK